MEKFNGKIKFKLEPKYYYSNQELDVAYRYYEQIEKIPKTQIKIIDWLISKKDIPSNYTMKCYVEMQKNIYAIFTSTRTKIIIVMECDKKGEIGNGLKLK